MADQAKASEGSERLASDEQLIEAVSRGDGAAFEVLVRRYQALALRAAYRFMGTSHEAEDIAQETFLRVYRNASLYEPVASFKTWFYQILTNLCRDARKKKKPLYRLDLLEDIASGDDPGRDLDRKERDRAVQRAIMKLAPNQRLTLILCHYEGLTYSEAAMGLDLSVKAVESLLVRAKRCLRKELADLIEKTDN